MQKQSRSQFGGRDEVEKLSEGGMLHWCVTHLLLTLGSQDIILIFTLLHNR
jgi:hypothetical protein